MFTYPFASSLKLVVWIWYYNTVQQLFIPLLNYLSGESWWSHQMEISSALLVLCKGNHQSPVDPCPPPQRPVTRNFDVLFDLRIKRRLSKQSKRWWIETPFRSLWRHCYAQAQSCLVCCYETSKYCPLAFRSLYDIRMTTLNDYHLGHICNLLNVSILRY